MAETDTAVLEPQETAELAPETEAPEEVVDTAEETPETDAAETPETGDTKPAAYTEEQVQERIRQEQEAWIASQRAAIEEQTRAQQAQQRRTTAEQVRRGETAQKIAGLAEWAYKQAEQGNEFRFNPQAAQALANEVATGVFQDQSDAWAEQFAGYLQSRYPGFKPSQQVAQGVAAAFRDWRPNDAVAWQFAAMEEAVAATLEPKLRQKWEADQKAKSQAAGKTNNLRNADAARRAGGNPTAGGDAGAPTNDSLSDIIANPLIPASERAKAYQKLHGIAAPGH